MKSKLLHESDGQRTFAIVLASEDEALHCLGRFAAAEGLAAASFSAIGAFRRAELAFFDWESKEYLAIPVDQQAEVVSMIGDVACGADDRPVVHAHAVLGTRDGTAIAGHFKEGIVRPTLEIILIESPAYLRKRRDPTSGLALLALD